MNWLKHFVWFMRESKSFLDSGYIRLIADGGLTKAYQHANFMVKWEKLTPKQKEYAYATRTDDFDIYGYMGSIGVSPAQLKTYEKSKKFLNNGRNKR